MRPRWRFAAVACLLIVGAAFPAVAQPQGETPAAQAQVLARAGITFPERLGAFTFERLSSVAPGRGGATYRSAAGALVDIFVAPESQSLAEELAATEAVLPRLLDNVRPVRDLPAPGSAPGARGRLWSGESERGSVYTAAMIWSRRGWRIKVRGTVPAEAGETAVAEIEELIRIFDWD